jgi:hypothetical protein
VSQNAVSVPVSVDALKPFITQTIEEVLDRLEGQRQTLPGNRLCFPEAEAAAMLGLLPHVLRDERRRGRIQASQIVGRRVVYQREDLLAYLRDRRINVEAE